MTATTASPLVATRLADLTIDDERAFAAVGLYRELKQRLVTDDVRFWVMAEGSWSRVLFLNLTYWGEGEADVLEAPRLPADVLAHVAWHHVAKRALGDASAEARLFGEAVASAFDLYLVGRLLPVAPDCDFLATQIPALTDAALAAGASEDQVETLLDEIAAAPERAFEDLRQLLFDAATRLVAPQPVSQAARALAGLDGHRFAPLLHHYELSNWLLHVRAAVPGALGHDPQVRALDAACRAAPGGDSLAVLERAWL